MDTKLLPASPESICLLYTSYYCERHISRLHESALRAICLPEMCIRDSL